MATTDWMRSAACRQRPDLDWFDTDCGLNEALTVCHSCPVMTPCLDYAISNELDEGVWGGLWGRNLTNMTKARGRHGG
jgi:WhiB family redox-sensing transcriptional regulator